MDLTDWGMLMGYHEGNGRRILALDFDVYNKKGCCEKTNEMLSKFLEKIDNQHGCFRTSTEGNFACLVEYTNDAGICALVNDFKQDKFKVHELEVLLRTNVAIPPTRSVCKRSNELGLSRSFLTDEPFYVFQNDEDCFVKTFITEMFQLNGTTDVTKKIKKNEKMIKQALPNVDSNSKTSYLNDKWMKLLFEVIQNPYDEEKHEYKVFHHVLNSEKLYDGLLQFDDLLASRIQLLVKQNCHNKEYFLDSLHLFYSHDGAFYILIFLDLTYFLN
jgi:hypothetical protein